MLRRLSVAAVLCLLAAAGPANALGLGDIKVNSALNQRFSAVIPFTSLSAEEAANVRARLGENQDFARAGLDRSAYLSSVSVEVITEGGRPRIELRGRDLAREPLLTLLVEVRTAGGPRILREYTVLLDPAVTAAGSTAAPSARTQNLPSQGAGGDSEFFQTAEESGRSSGSGRGTGASQAGGASGDPSRYGPVRSGETLSMIAEAVLPAGLSLEQVMLALYEANAGAFTNGDIDRLRKGSTLSVPSAEQMRSTPGVAARARVTELGAMADASTTTTGTMRSGSVAEKPSIAAAEPPIVSPPATLVAEAAPSSGADSGAGTTAGTDPATPGTSGSPAPGTGGTSSDAGSGTAATTAPADGSTAAVDPSTSTPPAAATTEAPAVAAPVADAPLPAAAAGSDWISWLLPLLIALILALIAFAAWRTSRERKAQRDYDEASRVSSSMPAPRMGATGQFAARGSARDELEAADRRAHDDDDATRIAGDDSERTRMVTTSRIPAYSGPQAASTRPMDAAELAVTTQFQANTQEINLGDNDPLSEAEFHLAYGLYDEAALLLQEASGRDPDRADLKIKLAETYFAAGKSAEFVQTAETLRGWVSADEWNKIAIMGRQLAPESALFSGGVDTGADTVLDLTFDDDATQIAPVKVDEGLEFNLEELELPTQTGTSGARSDAPLEFDLGEFDLGGDTQQSKPKTANEVNLQDFDLGGSDLSGPGNSHLDVTLDEVDPLVLNDPLDDEALSSGDDAATKLDLARAYVEMGDAEMARSLLDEVVKGGTDDQKREAGELRSRLLG